MYLSTEEYPSAVRLSRHLPFHRLSESLAGVFLSTMAPLTRWNSTSEFGWIPNRSRISFGMVTCPRSPTFIFSSMNQNTYLRKQQEGIHRGDGMRRPVSLAGCDKLPVGRTQGCKGDRHEKDYHQEDHDQQTAGATRRVQFLPGGRPGR